MCQKCNYKFVAIKAAVIQTSNIVQMSAAQVIYFDRNLYSKSVEVFRMQSYISM